MEERFLTHPVSSVDRSGVPKLWGCTVPKGEPVFDTCRRLLEGPIDGKVKVRVWSPS